jgi:hypothetical protein
MRQGHQQGAEIGGHNPPIPNHTGNPNRTNRYTLSFWSGGANALALLGYSDTQIQKMGGWKGATFKEYIHEELACYSAGMTTNMKRNFKFVNISGNAYHDITTKCVEEDYNTNCMAAAAA